MPPCRGGQWHALDIAWDTAAQTAGVSLDGKRVGSLPLRRETTGANYFRIRSTATGTDPAGLLVESVEVNITRR